MHFLEIPLRNLWRRPVRTLLTALGIVVGMGSLIALVGMSRGADRAFVEAALSRETHIIGIRKGAADMLMVSCDEAFGTELAKVDGIEAVTGELLGVLDIENEADGEMLHMIVTSWPRDSFLWESLALSSGTKPMEVDAEKFPIVLGQNWAETLNKKPGDAVELLGYPGEVVGVSKSDGIANRQMSFMALADLQRIVREEGKVTSFNIRLQDPGNESSREDFCSQLALQFPDLRFFPSEQLAAQSTSLGFLRALTGATSMIAITVALIVTLNTLLMSVSERTHEFGIYSAMGWKPSRILTLVLVEGAALSLIGGALGVFVGWLTLNWVASLPYLIAIETTPDPQLAIVGVLAMLIVGIGGSLYPAWRASRVQPAEALANR